MINIIDVLGRYDTVVLDNFRIMGNNRSDYSGTGEQIIISVDKVKEMMLSREIITDNMILSEIPADMKKYGNCIVSITRITDRNDPDDWATCGNRDGYYKLAITIK